VVDQHPAVRDQVHGVLSAFWRDVDAAALFADFGFGTRLSLRSDVLARIRRRVLPGTPETTDLAELFQLLFEPEDAGWLAAMDAATLSRVSGLLATPEAAWRASLLEAITILASAVHASGYAPALRQRMDHGLLATEPFRQITLCSNGLRRALAEGTHDEVLQAAMLFRTVLDGCRQAAATVDDHLEAFGVSVDIVYEADQLDARTRRIELLLDCVLAPAAAARTAAPAA
jgi:site-specific recombinase